MPLRNIYGNEVKPKKFEDAPIIIRARTQIGERSWGSMVRRVSEYVERKGADSLERGESSYHIFAIAMGQQGNMPAGDLNYVWGKAVEVFGDSDEAKRFLGTLQMYCFAMSEYNWVYIEDPEKKKKLAVGDIPEATQYFMEKPKAPKPTMQESIEALKQKFNRR